MWSEWHKTRGAQATTPTKQPLRLSLLLFHVFLKLINYNTIKIFKIKNQTVSLLGNVLVIYLLSERM